MARKAKSPHTRDGKCCKEGHKEPSAPVKAGYRENQQNCSDVANYGGPAHPRFSFFRQENVCGSEKQQQEGDTIHKNRLGHTVGCALKI